MGSSDLKDRLQQNSGASSGSPGDELEETAGLLGTGLLELDRSLKAGVTGGGGVWEDGGDRERDSSLHSEPQLENYRAGMLKP